MNLIPIGQSASVKVIIDPRAAKREVDGLRREMVKLEEARKKFREEMEHTIDGTARVLGNKADPNSPAGKQAGGRDGDRPAKAESEGARRAASQGRGILGTIRDAIDYTRIGAGWLKKIPQGTTVLKELAKGTWFEDSARVVDDAARKAADLAVSGSATVRGGLDTVTDVVDYNIAALKLGGAYPKDQDALIKDFYDINRSRAQLTESFELERGRLVTEIGAKALFKTLSESARAVIGR